MTNLEIIRYLAFNNPERLAELIDDIYCTAWNCGSCAASTGKFMEVSEIDDFNEWLNEDAEKRGYYYDHELEEWSKAINPISTLEVFYGSKSKVIDQAIDEIGLLEDLVKENK